MPTFGVLGYYPPAFFTMASIQFGNGVSQIRGSINGTTFSRNKNGAFARNRVKGTNPRTQRQIVQRGLLTSLSSAWRDLTAQQRKTFTDGAPNFPYTNRVGETSTYTGPQLYNKLNLALLAIGEPALTECPTPEKFPTLGSAALTFTVSTGVLSAELRFGSSLPVGFTAQVFASTSVSAGRNAASTSKRLVATVAGAGTATIAFGAGYTSVYGVPALGANIVVEMKITNIATGQQATVFTGSGIVAAP